MAQLVKAEPQDQADHQAQLEKPVKTAKTANQEARAKMESKEPKVHQDPKETQAPMVQLDPKATQVRKENQDQQDLQVHQAQVAKMEPPAPRDPTAKMVVQAVQAKMPNIVHAPDVILKMRRKRNWLKEQVDKEMLNILNFYFASIFKF